MLCRCDDLPTSRRPTKDLKIGFLRLSYSVGFMKLYFSHCSGGQIRQVEVRPFEFPQIGKTSNWQKVLRPFFTYTEVDSKYLSLLHNLHDDILICLASLSYSASCGAEIGVRILVGYLRAAWVHQRRHKKS